MPLLTRAVAFVALIAVLVVRAPAARADDMTVADLVSLKKLGFSDAEMKAAVEKSGTKLQLSDDDVKALKAAGVSDDLVKSLKHMAGPKELPISAIVEMAKAGKTADQILDAMLVTPSKYTLAPADALNLVKQNVPAAVVMAIKGKPLTAVEVKTLADAKVASSVYEKLATIVGYARQDLPAADALALVKAGVPQEVVAGLKQGRAPALGQGPADANVGEYHHPAGYFTLRYPPNWNVVRDEEEGAAQFTLTPEPGRTRARDADVAISVTLLVADPNSPVAGKDPVALMKHLLPIYRTLEPDIAIQGDPAPAKLGQLAAARVAWKGKPSRKKETGGVFAGEMYMTQDHGIIYGAVCGAPEAQYPQLQEPMRKVIEQSDFGPTAPSRRGPPQEPNEIVNRYKDSVVCILADLGNGMMSSGTGFIIHKAGYVATNAHVALDLEHGGKTAKTYWALYDSGTGKKRQPLTYVGSHYQPARQRENYGVDIALFKLPPGEYTPLPLSPLRDVQLGDPIVTMGFPHYFDFKTVNLFTTGGVVTRFNRALDGTVESMFMDAKTTHGNSGGPCLNRVTGAVIGLNTFGHDIVVDPRAQGANDLVGYNGIVPIDAYIAEWPLIAELGKDPDVDTVDFADAFALAKLYSDLKRYRAGVELARGAVKQQPRSADAHALLGECLMKPLYEPPAPKLGDFQPKTADAVAEFTQALDIDPKHEGACLNLSLLYLITGDLSKATQYVDRAVKAHPDHSLPFVQQAMIYQSLKQYDEALAAARKASELGHDVSADGHVIAGQVLYAQNKLDEGKAEFAHASQIHPTNLMARLGIGQYFELKKNFEAALVEYGRVDLDLADNAAVYAAMGRCNYQLKRYDDAVEKYDGSISKAADAGQTPPVEAFLTIGSILADQKGKPEVAVNVYARGLMYYGASPVGAEMHLRMAKVFRDKNFKGVAFSHLCRAGVLQPDNAAAKQQLAARDLPRLAMDDVVFLIKKAQYPESLIADMVECTPLGFRPKLDTEADARKLVDEQGIPPLIIKAMITSNKQFPPENGGGGGGGGGGGNPLDPAGGGGNGGGGGGGGGNIADAHPDAVVGTWATTLQAQGSTATMRVVFAKNGRYATTINVPGRAPVQDQGAWHVEGGNLVDHSETFGTDETLPFRVNGDTLETEIPNMGKLTFKRQQQQQQ